MTFWDAFWSMFWVCVIFIPLLCIWMFSIFDIFVRSMNGWAKAFWLCAVVFFPVIGTVVYLIVRPGKDPTPSYAYAGPPAYDAGPPATVSAPVAQLQALSTLHEDGKLTDAEFESAKARVIGPVPGTGAARPSAAA